MTVVRDRMENDMDTSLLDQSPIMSAEALCLSIARQYEARVGHGHNDDGRSRSLVRTMREYHDVLSTSAVQFTGRDLLAAWSMSLHAHGDPDGFGQLGGATGRCLTIAEWITLAGGIPRGDDELREGDYANGLTLLSELARYFGERYMSALHDRRYGAYDRRYAAMAATSDREHAWAEAFLARTW